MGARDTCCSIASPRIALSPELEGTESMPKHLVLILGAGAAGTAAAQVLKASDAVSVELVTRTGELPYNRTLVNKGVAVGILTAEQATVPAHGAVGDTAELVDPASRTVHFASGNIARCDALVVATGSTPKNLASVVPGAAEATAAGRLTTLHSLDDAVRVRSVLARQDAPSRIVIFGAGLVAAETASLLRERGRHITLVARSTEPGATAFGPEIAARLAAAHQEHLATAFGRTATAIEVDSAGLTIALDDGSRIHADLAIVAHGSTPAAPAPWFAGVAVDEHLRTRYPRVYGAGGSAIHTDAMLGTWRIDHWADAVAQGEHAARVLLHDLGFGADPGPYLPRSPYTALIHGRTVAGVGMTGGYGSARVVAPDPLVVVHKEDDDSIGAVGIDATASVFEWIPRLHSGARVPG
ncbi:FAD-dependent oxidoreductase [Lysobacter korlensis]|uniref:FAD-dependent oxidoreductase n=1 Tax=Lysobacter korlensis TaxID=553636 RepID=A0ABV6RTL7_9GAMM